MQNQHAKCRDEHKGDGEEGDYLGEDARVRLFHQVPQASLVSGIKMMMTLISGTANSKAQI